MVRYCAVYACYQNTYSNKNLRLFNFPSDEQRCRYWIKTIGRTDLENKSMRTLYTSYYVCELHFAPSDYVRKKLKRGVVPSLFLPQMENLSGTSKYTQTDVNLSSNRSKCSQTTDDIMFPSEKSRNKSEVSSITESLRSVQTTSNLSKVSPELKDLQNELKSEIIQRRLLESVTENFAYINKLDMPPLLKKFIDAQKVLKHKFQGNRYDKEYIMFALNIYFSSPTAYRFLSETLCLPSKRTLQRHLAVSITTNFDENAIKYLQSKSRNMSNYEKCCIICADEMPLKRHLFYQIKKDKVVGFHEIGEKQSKEIATQAFVVMARGIYSNWNQPLAFCFLNQSKNYAKLDTWLDNIIANMTEIGFNVCAFVSDQGSNFLNMTNKSVSPDKPFFFINGKKIYYIFDVPHLMKSLRNNLINYDFVYHDDDGSEQVASWNDIERMYDVEKNTGYKMAFKLTESHIRPNSAEKMRVKYATQVLSRTVAVTIYALVQSGKLHEKCLGSTTFIELINNTFDILNSSTASDDYEYKKAFCQAEYQITTLKKAQRIISGLRVINRINGKDVTSKMKFIKGFLISINAILSLASDLKSMGSKYLFTRRLNQDLLQSFFVKVRQQCGNRRKPTAIQFVTAFKKLYIANMVRHSEHSNCVRDLDQLLTSAKETLNYVRSNKNVSMDLSERVLQVETYDYRFELPEVNAFTYVCEYLLKKCYEVHKDCDIMKNYIKINQNIHDQNNFTHFKEHKTDHRFGALINAAEKFQQYIKQIDDICVDHFINCDFFHVGNEMMTKLDKIEFSLPCPCFPLQFLKKLFVRFRIFNVMRYNNKNFRDKSIRRKYFSVSQLGISEIGTV